MVDMAESKRWHVYGGERDLGPALGSDEPCVVWQQVVIGPSPDGPPVQVGGSPYLATFDHEPTEAEKALLTPPDFRDEWDDDAVDTEEAG